MNFTHLNVNPFALLKLRKHVTIVSTHLMVSPIGHDEGASRCQLDFWVDDSLMRGRFFPHLSLMRLFGVVISALCYIVCVML